MTTKTRCPICGHETTMARVERGLRKIVNQTVDGTYKRLKQLSKALAKK